MNFKASRFLICAAASSALFGATAVAQEEGGGDLAIEEILVTAQKRAESLQDVPIAISVFNADSIDKSGVQELRDLSEYIPNVNVSQGTDFGARIQIRGVGANARNIGFDSRVGVYLDGVYLGQGPALNQDLVDLNHIEILRGPQGTLFGKNTVAGAINMISKKPAPEFSANVSANIFNYDGLELKADANIPLGDTVSARVYISDRSRDGFVKNVYDPSHLPSTFYFPHPAAGIIPLPFPLPTPFCSGLLGGAPVPDGFCQAPGPSEAPNTKIKMNDVDTQSYRAQLRITPNEKLDINLSVDGLESDRHPLLGEPFTDTFGSTLDRFAPGYAEVSYSEVGSETRDIFGASATVDYDFDNGYAFKSITAYRDTEIRYINDTDTSALDFLYIDYRDDYEQTSQEFQLISPGDSNFKYVAGFYYYNQDSSSEWDAVTGNAGWLFGIPPGGGAFKNGTVETDSWAVFMNGSYDFTDRMRLGFGFRYSDETKDVVFNLDGTRSGVFGIGTTAPGGLIDSDTYTNFSPTIDLNYALGDSTNVYVKYSTGFKSGGFNLDYITQADLERGIDFADETVDSYELGLKGKFFDDRLSVNAAVFSAQFDDYQVNQFFDLGFDPATGTQITSIRITNAAKVDTSGLEIEATFNATSNLTFNASLGLLDATFDDFPGGTSVEEPNPDGGAPIKVPVNAAGNDLPLAPDLNASFGFQYFTPIEALGSELMISLDILHTGEFFTTIENETFRNLTGTHVGTLVFDIGQYGIPNQIRYGEVKALTTLNGRIGLIDGDGKWDVYLWGRNLTDENEYVDYFRDFFGSLSATPTTPRTYGIEAAWHF